MHDDTQRAPTKKRRPPQLEAPGQQASKEGVRIDPACSVLAVQGHVHATHGRFLASLRRQKDQRRSDARRRFARGPYTIRSSMSLPVFFYFGFFPATSCTGAWAVCELGSTTHPPGRLTRRSRRRGSRRQTLSATIGRRQLLHTWQKAKSSLESCLNSGRTCPFLIGVYCYSGTCPRHVDRFMLLEFSS